MIKRISTGLTLLLFAATSFAAEPIVYEVKKGDTLWGISEAFIKDPHYWPDLWGKNPGLSNPHLIYPGQKLNIYGDRIEFEKDAIPVVEKKVEVSAEPLDAMFLKISAPIHFAEGLSGDDWGMILDSDDEKTFLSVDDVVFVELPKNAKGEVGEILALASYSDPIKHPHTEQEMGVVVTVTGTIQIDRILETGVAVATIKTSNQEVERGNSVFVYNNDVREIEIKKAKADLFGVVAVSADGRTMLGQEDTVILDIGALDGVEKGNFFYVTRPRQATKVAQKANLAKPDIKLPEAILGAALVVDVRESTSTAILVKVGADVEVGDRVISVSDDPWLQ